MIDLTALSPDRQRKAVLESPLLEARAKIFDGAYVSLACERTRVVFAREAAWAERTRSVTRDADGNTTRWSGYPLARVGS